MAKQHATSTHDLAESDEEKMRKYPLHWACSEGDFAAAEAALASGHAVDAVWGEYDMQPMVGRASRAASPSPSC